MDPYDLKIVILIIWLVVPFYMGLRAGLVSVGSLLNKNHNRLSVLIRSFGEAEVTWTAFTVFGLFIILFLRLIGVYTPEENEGLALYFFFISAVISSVIYFVVVTIAALVRRKPPVLDSDNRS